MASSPTETPGPEPVKLIARRLHLVLVLAIFAVLNYGDANRAEHITQSAAANRPLFYIVSMASTWLIFAVVLSGLKSYGTPRSAILGKRWHSARDFARDAGIAAVFWMLSTLILSAVAQALHADAANDAVRALIPHGWLESILWVGVSITAGICEEAIFRGYIQHQLTAVTRSVPVGIVLSALAFGLSHGYKSWGGLAVISLDGLMLGTLAYWRNSLRPGMIAHSFGDIFAGVLAGLLKVKVA